MRNFKLGRHETRKRRYTRFSSVTQSLHICLHHEVMSQHNICTNSNLYSNLYLQSLNVRTEWFSSHLWNLWWISVVKSLPSTLKMAHENLSLHPLNDIANTVSRRKTSQRRAFKNFATELVTSRYLYIMPPYNSARLIVFVWIHFRSCNSQQERVSTDQHEFHRRMIRRSKKKVKTNELSYR